VTICGFVIVRVVFMRARRIGVVVGMTLVNQSGIFKQPVRRRRQPQGQHYQR
jgi:hypothetical protein